MYDSVGMTPEEVIGVIEPGRANREKIRILRAQESSPALTAALNQGGLPGRMARCIL